jgi:hypothetical protein
VARSFTSLVARFPRRGHPQGKGAMARKKISTTIYITPEQNERLKVLHERTKVPVAVYIREGIDLVLDRHRDQLPGQLTFGIGARDEDEE